MNDCLRPNSAIQISAIVRILRGSMRLITTLLLLFSFSVNAEEPSGNSTYELSNISLGPLKLENNPTVSVETLRELFPHLQINYGVYSGDSPDFHRFEIAEKDGTLLFVITSFIEDTSTRHREVGESTSVPIHILKVVSPKISDSHGLRVGNSVADIIQARGDRLTFGANHFDVYLGDNKIFYNIRTTYDRSPERYTYEDTKRENWPIVSISWPEPAWE